MVYFNSIIVEKLSALVSAIDERRSIRCNEEDDIMEFCHEAECWLTWPMPEVYELYNDEAFYDYVNNIIKLALREKREPPCRFKHCWGGCATWESHCGGSLYND